MWFIWFVLSFFICHTLFNFFLRSKNFYKFEEMKNEYTKNDVDPYSNRIIGAIIIYGVVLVLIFTLDFIDTWAAIVGNMVGFITGYFHYSTDLKIHQNRENRSSLNNEGKMLNTASVSNKSKSQIENHETNRKIGIHTNDANKNDEILDVDTNIITYKTINIPLDYEEYDWHSEVNDILVDLIKDIVSERKTKNYYIDYEGLLEIIKEALQRIGNFSEEEKLKIVTRFSRYWESEMDFENISFTMDISEFEEVFWILKEVFEKYTLDDEFDALPDSLYKRAILNERKAKMGDTEALLLHAKNIGWGFVFEQDLFGYNCYIDRLSTLAYNGNIEARFLLGSLYSLSDSQYASKAACYSYSLGVNLKDKRSLLKINNIKFINFKSSDFDDYNFNTPTHDTESKFDFCSEQKVINKMDVSMHLNELSRIGKPDFSNKADGFLFCDNIPFTIEPTKCVKMITLDIDEYCAQLNQRGLKSKIIENVGFGYSAKDPIGYKHVNGIYVLDDYFKFIMPIIYGKWDLFEYYRIGSFADSVDKYFVSYKNDKNEVLVYTLYFWMYDNNETAFPFLENIYRLPKGFAPNTENPPVEYRYLEKTTLNIEENLFGNEYYYSLLIGESQSVKQKDS